MEQTKFSWIILTSVKYDVNTFLSDGIRNIVINDDVGIAINEAYVNIVKAKHHLKQNNLVEAVTYARQAFESSERAFFDPSLLALLYFPDDQK